MGFRKTADGRQHVLRWRGAAALLIVFVVTAAGGAVRAGADGAALAALTAPGAVGIMRHAAQPRAIAIP